MFRLEIWFVSNVTYRVSSTIHKLLYVLDFLARSYFIFRNSLQVEDQVDCSKPCPKSTEICIERTV